MPFDFDDEDTIPAEQLEGPVLAVRGRVLLADFAATGGPHRFGGPLALDVRAAGGKAAGGKPPALHRLLTLSLSDPLLGFAIDGVSKLPLLYGFTYDGCRLKYRVAGDRQVELLEMKPSSPAADWPYAGYPPAFPERRFALRDDGEIDAEQIHELTWQGVEGIDPADGVVAIVPPAGQYRVSLWGPAGDAERVQVVFEIDPAARTVAAYNQCG